MKSLHEVTAKLTAPLGNLSRYDMVDVSLDREGARFVLDIYQPSLLGHSHSYASYAAQTEFPLRFPERKQVDGSSKWLVAATDISAHVLTSVWPAAQMKCEPDAFKMLQYLLLSGAQQDCNAETSARYREYVAWRNTLPANDRHEHDATARRMILGKAADNYRCKAELPLAIHQDCSLHNSYRSEGYGLFLEQGCGKTAVIISEVNTLAAINGSKCIKVLIVAPKNVRLNWQREFEKFSTEKGCVTILRGDEIERTKLFIDAMVACKDNKFSVVVCSYESMSRSIHLLQSVEWDLCALDESHYIKRPETQRARAAMKLRENCKRRRCLTGTPVTNTILDLFSQLEFLGQGCSGFLSWKNFREFYGVWDKDMDGRSKLVSIQNLPFMQERLARLTSIVSKRDALPDLPPITYDVIEVEMSKEQAEVYDKVATELCYEIENELNSDLNKSLVVNNMLTKLLRLAQITSGFIVFDPVYGDDGEIVSARQIDRFDPNPKLEALFEELKTREPGSKTIVWACWIQDIKSIAARAALEGIDAVTFYGGTNDTDRAEAERKFNFEPSCTLFIGNPASGGTGLNLIGYPPGEEDSYTTNCDWEIYYSQNWSPTARSQSEARPHRTGTRCHVRASDLCVPKTIDEEIRARVVDKRNMALTIGDIRQILQRAINHV